MRKIPVSQKIISLESRSSIEIEFHDLFVDGSLPLYRHVEERGLIFLGFRKGRVVISAGAYVGLIPLHPYLTIEILPKLPVKNLSRVLEIARAFLGRLRGTARTYPQEERPEASVLTFIAANFIDAVRAIEVTGFMKDYTRRRQATSRPRGRILIGETRKQCWFRGRHSSVVAEQFVQSADIELNRIIKTALLSILKTLGSMENTDGSILGEVAQCFRDFPGEIRVLSTLEKEAAVFNYRALDHINLRPDYQRALEIAFMVLNAEGISLDRQGLDRTLNSFILNLEEVVENYFRNALRHLAGPDIVIEDGNKEAKRALFKNQPNGPPAQPDMVLRRLGNSALIVSEVKYKTKIDRADINQAVTYAVTFGTKEVVLIHIASPKGKRRAYLIGETGDIKVRGYAFDLSSEDLEAEELAMYRYLTGLL